MQHWPPATVGRRMKTAALAPLPLAAWGAPAAAADDEAKKEPRRTRVGVGAQLVPSWPGSDDYSLRPLVDVSRSRGSRPFDFEAPDESFGPSLIEEGGLEIGPALNLQGSRKASDVGTDLDKIPFTFEAGAFVQYAFGPKFRIRTELRKG